MDAPRFDTLTRSLAGIRTRRSALRGLLLGTGSFISLAAAQDTTAKNCRKIKNPRRRRKCQAKAVPGRCVPQCSNGCCGTDSCFAESVDSNAPENGTFACCPSDKLCRSTNPNFDFQDQCCYPDETCRPSLVDEFGLDTETICCRPCGNECCLKQTEECIAGACKEINTARLPRYRRPG